jgi:hypothetical protein
MQQGSSDMLVLKIVIETTVATMRMVMMVIAKSTDYSLQGSGDLINTN